MIALAGFTQHLSAATINQRRYTLAHMAKKDADFDKRLRLLVMGDLPVGGDPVDQRRVKWVLDCLAGDYSPAMFLTIAQVDEIWLEQFGPA